MAKVTFEFDDIEDREDVNFIVNRYSIISSLREICDLNSAIYNSKLYNGELISVKDGKVLTEEDYNKYYENGEYPVKDTKGYVDRDYIENRLSEIIDGFYHIIDT